MSECEVGQFRDWVRSASSEAEEPLCACLAPDGWLAIRLDPIALARRGLGMRSNVVALIAPGTSGEEARRLVGEILEGRARWTP